MTKIVRTVLGDVDPAGIGITLCHEHLAMDAREGFGDPDIYLGNPDWVAEDLEEAKQHGLRTVVEVSTIGMQRRPLDFVRIAELTGLNVVAGAGFYHGHFLPAYVHALDVPAMVDMIVRDLEEGMEGTNVRAGAIGEVGASVGEITPTEQRLFLAAGQAQNLTNAAIITHTDVGKMGTDQLDLLEKGGADPGRVLVGHMDCNFDLSFHLAVARRGAFVGFDRVGLAKFGPDADRVRTIVGLIEHGFADKVILSHDLARTSRLRRNGGKGYGYIPREFVPMLRVAGVDEATVNAILVDNPRRLLAFTPRK
ncbi:MAG: phosphotriesterase family protein [Chloroflexota bacterium]